MWSRDGRELFYAQGQQLWAVSVETDSEKGFHPGPPRFLFEGPYDLRGGGPGIHSHYDVAPDGRFIVLNRDSGRPTCNVILNWGEELERRVPTE